MDLTYKIHGKEYLDDIRVWCKLNFTSIFELAKQCKKHKQYFYDTVKRNNVVCIGVSKRVKEVTGIDASDYLLDNQE